MINGVWIIKKEAGICIFHKNYADWEIDPQLFSAFLSGIYKFSEGISETEGIEIIEMQNMSVLYKFVSDLFFILSITKDEEIEVMRQKMTELSSEFINKFKDYLQNWKENIGAFKWFGADLDRIVGRNTTQVVEIPIKLPEKKRLSLTNEELGVLLCIDGKTPSSTIANKLNIPNFEFMLILKSLEKKKLIQVRKVIENIE
ncbi:MAG: hypothetical protein LUQ65_12135 [Candidatus Helarchaeota archaeon]|nr:hypothetical protein [Candidatus Helarchaeota archaeon]